MKRSGVLARLRLPLLLVVGPVAYGTLAYQLVEAQGVLDAFHMTVITLTAVGYGEADPLVRARPARLTLS